MPTAPKPIKIHDKLFYEQLELSVLFDKLKSLCVCEPAQDLVDRLMLYRDAESITRMQAEMSEMRGILDSEMPWRIHRYTELQEILKHLAVPGYVLELEELAQIRHNLQSMHQLQKAWKAKEAEDEYPHVESMMDWPEETSKLLEKIDRLLDSRDQVRDDASPALGRISTELGRLRGRLSERFSSLKKQYSQSSYLSDSEETMRNGRRVFSVEVTHKRAIPGIIHDYSSTGKTAFIEPQDLVIMHNDIQEKHHERLQELRRLILALCDELRPYREELQSGTDSLTQLDLLQGKARLMAIIGAHPVRCSPDPIIVLKEARHPVLLLKYLNDPRDVVAFDLRLDSDTRVLILSGPNAGGKTVTMKTVGLLQALFQCGMPISCGEGSQLGIYHQIFTDIGDQQSIDDELSTYSSKMQSLTYFLKKSSSRTLLLLDEFGSGTDPQIGGAIAESILLALSRKNAYVITTTHYPNLKILAHKHPVMINGAMSYDDEKLEPGFSLVLGHPGNSYAFEIAQRMGVPEHILAKARELAGDNQVMLEGILSSLQSKEQKLIDLEQSAEDKQRKLDRLIDNYDRMNKSLEARRRKVRLQSKEMELELRTKIDKELASVKTELQDIKETASLEKVKDKLDQRKKSLRSDSVKIKEEMLREEEQESGGPIEVGSHVRLRGGDLGGEVVEIDGNRVYIHTGLMRVEAPMRDLVRTIKPIATNRNRSIQIQTTSSVADIKDRIDLRGIKAAEARAILETYMDRALLKKLSGFTIIHGKGTGQLRDALWEVLKTYPSAIEYSHPADEQGGKGITLVSFA